MRGAWERPRVLTFSWAFTSEAREVSFGIFFNDGFDVDYRQADLTCLKPSVTYDSHLQEVRWACMGRGGRVRDPLTSFWAGVGALDLQATGTVVVNAPGTYILRWDNSGAFTSRAIRYLVSP